MTWVDARHRPRVTDKADRVVTRVKAFPAPDWASRDISGEEAERWYGWAPILAMRETAITTADGRAMYVALVPDLPYTKDGETVKAQGVLWGPADSSKPADGGRLYRTLAPARKFYEQLTNGRERGDDPREW